MKLGIINIFLTFYVVILFSCSKDKPIALNESVITGFPPAIELNGEVIFEKEYSNLYLKEVDSLMIISTGRDTLIRIYNKTGVNIYNFGTFGRGPKEFSETPIISDTYKNEDSTVSLFIFDSQILKYSKINLTNSIKIKDLIIDTEFEFPGELNGAYDIFYINEDTLMGIYSDHFYKKLNGLWGGFYYYPKSNNFKTFDLTNNLTIEPYETLASANLNARISSLSPDRTKLAIINIHTPVLEIVKVGSNQTKKYFLGFKPSRFVYNLHDFLNQDITEYYTYIKTSNSYIYLLHVNQKNSVDNREVRIQVIDWEGVPQTEYLIPKKYGIGMFTVDESESLIYGLSYSNDSIYMFDYNKMK